ncbi:MAG: ACP S-malonyltransferase [Acidimicrobiales bacterium]|nr:ACP S-malonyltransferase [Acidimicrobiales bacterium]
MGRAWFEKSPDAARTFGAADELIGDRFGRRLSEICFEGPQDLLDRTDVAQPAIYTVTVACFQALYSDTDPKQFTAFAGLSLGEYSALHLAGAFSFADGLELVALRGQAMQEAAEAADTSMVAVIGAEEDAVRALCNDAAADEHLVPANFNAPGQIVISGGRAACERAVQIGSERGMRLTPLAVAGAFHSPYMAPAAARLEAALEKTAISMPLNLVMSNVSGQPSSEPDQTPEDPAAVIRRNLVDQLTHPVLWAQGCQWLVSHLSAEYHELAPGKVLAGLMRRIDREVKVQRHDEPH